MLFWLHGTTPTLAMASTCFLIAWLEVFAVAMATVMEVSFMPRSLPEEMRNKRASVEEEQQTHEADIKEDF